MTVNAPKPPSPSAARADTVRKRGVVMIGRAGLEGRCKQAVSDDTG